MRGQKTVILAQRLLEGGRPGQSAINQCTAEKGGRWRCGSNVILQDVVRSVSETRSLIIATTSNPWGMVFTNLGKLGKQVQGKRLYLVKHFFFFSIPDQFILFIIFKYYEKSLLLFINGKIQKEEQNARLLLIRMRICTKVLSFEVSWVSGSRCLQHPSIPQIREVWSMSRRCQKHVLPDPLRPGH